MKPEQHIEKRFACGGRMEHIILQRTANNAPPC
jgi:hypothetical protein